MDDAVDFNNILQQTILPDGPVNPSEIAIFDPQTDPSFHALQEAMSRVVRFKDSDESDRPRVYPNDIFTPNGRSDTVLTHTYHVVQIARLLQEQDAAIRVLLGIEEDEVFINWNEVIRILQIHDLPETNPEVGDHPELLPKYPLKVGKELQAAEVIFNKDRQSLAQFVDFQSAELLLRGVRPAHMPSAEAVVAKVIDFIEGNFRYFDFVHQYISNGGQPDNPALLFSKAWKYYEIHESAIQRALASGIEMRQAVNSGYSHLLHLIEWMFQQYRKNEIITLLRGHEGEH